MMLILRNGNQVTFNIEIRFQEVEYWARSILALFTAFVSFI